MSILINNVEVKITSVLVRSLNYGQNFPEAPSVEYKLIMALSEFIEIANDFYQEYAEDDICINEKDIPIEVSNLRSLGWPNLIILLVQYTDLLVEFILNIIDQDILEEIFKRIDSNPKPDFLLNGISSISIKENFITFCGPAIHISRKEG